MEQFDSSNGEGVNPEKDQIVEPIAEEEPTQEQPSMEVLLEEQGLSLDFPRPGEVRTGIRVGQDVIGMVRVVGDRLHRRDDGAAQRVARPYLGERPAVGGGVSGTYLERLAAGEADAKDDVVGCTGVSG